MSAFSDTKAIELQKSTSEFANKSSQGTTEAHARLEDGEDETEQFLKCLNVGLPNSTEDDDTNFHEGLNLDHDVKNLTEGESPEHNEEASVHNEEGVDKFQEFLQGFNVDVEISTEGESPEHNEEATGSNGDGNVETEECPKNDGVGCADQEDDRERHLIVRGNELPAFSEISPASLLQLSSVLRTYKVDPFKRYHDIVSSNDFSYISDDNPFYWSAYKKKSLIEQCHEAMYKPSVSEKVLDILKTDSFKKITEEIVGKDWSKKIDPHLLNLFSDKQTKLRNTIEDIKCDKKREEVKRRVFSENIIVDFLNILAMVRNMVHYSKQHDLATLRKVLGGDTFPDNVIDYIEERFPGFVVHLLVVFKSAYPSKDLLRNVVQY